MKVLFEEYGRMVLSVICGTIVIILLALLMTKLGEVNNDHLANAVGAETSIIPDSTQASEEETTNNETEDAETTPDTTKTSISYEDETIGDFEW